MDIQVFLSICLLIFIPPLLSREVSRPLRLFTYAVSQTLLFPFPLSTPSLPTHYPLTPVMHILHASWPISSCLKVSPLMLQPFKPEMGRHIHTHTQVYWYVAIWVVVIVVVFNFKRLIGPQIRYIHYSLCSSVHYNVLQRT